MGNHRLQVLALQAADFPLLAVEAAGHQLRGVDPARHVASGLRVGLVHVAPAGVDRSLSLVGKPQPKRRALRFPTNWPRCRCCYGGMTTTCVRRSM